MLKPLVDNTTYKLNGQLVSREEFLAGSKGFCFGEDTATPHPAGWPMASESLGCHPDQIQESVDYAREKGVPTDFTPDGRPICDSPGHRKRYCEALGYYDRNGGYGDPQRK